MKTPTLVSNDMSVNLVADCLPTRTISNDTISFTLRKSRTNAKFVVKPSVNLLCTKITFGYTPVKRPTPAMDANFVSHLPPYCGSTKYVTTVVRLLRVKRVLPWLLGPKTAAVSAPALSNVTHCWWNTFSEPIQTKRYNSFSVKRANNGSWIKRSSSRTSETTKRTFSVATVTGRSARCKR